MNYIPQITDPQKVEKKPGRNGNILATWIIAAMCLATVTCTALGAAQIWQIIIEIL